MRLPKLSARSDSLYVKVIITAVSVSLLFVSFYLGSKYQNRVGLGCDLSSNRPVKCASENKDEVYENISGYKITYPRDILNLSYMDHMNSFSIDSEEIILSLKKSPGSGSSSSYYTNPSMVIDSLDSSKNRNKLNLMYDDCSRYSGEKVFSSLQEFASLFYSRVSNPNCKRNRVVSELQRGQHGLFGESYQFVVESDGMETPSGGFSGPPNSLIKYLMFKRDGIYYLIGYNKNEESFEKVLNSFEFRQLSNVN